MPPYDDRLFVPPAPVLNARLRNPQSGTIVPEVRLLIDTGADVTLLQEVGILGRNILIRSSARWSTPELERA